jgi:hypothetical protein
MFGCCAPEGMRAIHTAWINTIDHISKSALGPAGVYVNLSFSRNSKWGRVVSFMPDSGRLTVKASVADSFFLRSPSWAPRGAVNAFVGVKRVETKWSGDYVQFEAHPGDELTITYPLVEFDHEVAGLWTNTAPTLRLSFHWRGDQVVSSDPPPKGTPLFTGAPRLMPLPPE